jgi:hypothetical protein
MNCLKGAKSSTTRIRIVDTLAPPNFTKSDYTFSVRGDGYRTLQHYKASSALREICQLLVTLHFIKILGSLRENCEQNAQFQITNGHHCIERFIVVGLQRKDLIPKASLHDAFCHFGSQSPAIKRSLCSVSPQLCLDHSF